MKRVRNIQNLGKIASYECFSIHIHKGEDEALPYQSHSGREA